MNISPDIRAWVSEEVRSQLANYELRQQSASSVGGGLSLQDGYADVFGYDAPWDVTFSGAQASFKRCVLLRGPETKLLDDISYTIMGSDGTIYLSAEWNTNGDTVAIIEGTSLASVTDSTPPAGTKSRRLLYVVSKVTVGGNVRVRIVEDHRRNPMNVAYI